MKKQFFRKWVDGFKLKNKQKNETNKKWFLAKIQILGRTFMLPIAMLAFCGILLGIGASLTGEHQIQQMPWLGTVGLTHFFLFLKSVGAIGFTFLPFIFAMAVPLGLASNNKGVAGLSGFIAYATLLFIINFMINVLPDNLTNKDSYIGRSTVETLGIKTMDVGILGAILAGLLVYLIHERFQYITLPNAIGFWGGRRFAPLFTLIVFSAIAIPLTFIWPGIGLGMYYAGVGVQKVDWFGPFLYRFTESLVRPTGLHHVVNTTIRFTEMGGTYTSPVDGKTYAGALNIFYHQLEKGLPIDYRYTRFLSQGYMPTVMFALPAVAMAIYFNSDKQQRKMVKSVIVPGIVAAVVGGITEPIEFLFLFVAPLLYFFHCFMTGLAYLILGLLEVKIGNTDGNLIDLIIFGFMQGMATKWYWVLVVGVAWAAIYFTVFYFTIKKFDIKTIGRDGTLSEMDGSDTNEVNQEKNQNINDKIKTNKKHKSNYQDEQMAQKIYQLLGGKENIKILDNCFTRLRITLNSDTSITETDVKSLGAIGLVKINATNIQIIIGTKVEKIKNLIAKLMI